MTHPLPLATPFRRGFSWRPKKSLLSLRLFQSFIWNDGAGALLTQPLSAQPQKEGAAGACRKGQCVNAVKSLPKIPGNVGHP
jgi:hypothetical protein